MDQLGPRARRVYAALRDRILSGDLASGTKLPRQSELAADFGVAPMTLREVLARLEDEGLVSQEHGRGTFVRTPSIAAVLIIDDEDAMRDLLGQFVAQAGFRAIEATNHDQAIAAIEQDPSVVLVLADVRMPTAEIGTNLIRAIRRRWPDIPLAAVTAYPDDLSGLLGTPECPVMIVPKPFRPAQVEEALALASAHRHRRLRDVS